MRRFSVISGLIVLTVVLAASAVSAAPVEFVATLSGAAENPSNASLGTGLAHVTFDVEAHTLHVEVTFSGLTVGNTAAHIHCCTAPPNNVGVATTLPTFTGFPTGVTSGLYVNTFDTSLASSFNQPFINAHGGTVASAETALFEGMVLGQSYLNIHTSTFPGGEIRGFLVTPEPGTVLLLSTGLAGLAQQLWRKRRSR